MRRIYFDSRMFIYLLESHPTYGERSRRIVKSMLERSDSIVTSALTIGEVLARPIALGEEALIRAYDDLFRKPLLEVVSLDADIARRSAQIRAASEVSSPDSIHLASAAARKCDLFITHDARLTRLIIPGIQFITTLENAPL